jgi:hypothetical protein
MWRAICTTAIIGAHIGEEFAPESLRKKQAPVRDEQEVGKSSLFARTKRFAAAD